MLTLFYTVTVYLQGYNHLIFLIKLKNIKIKGMFYPCLSILKGCFAVLHFDKEHNDSSIASGLMCKMKLWENYLVLMNYNSPE